MKSIEEIRGFKNLIESVENYRKYLLSYMDVLKEKEHKRFFMDEKSRNEIKNLCDELYEKENLLNGNLQESEFTESQTLGELLEKLEEMEEAACTGDFMSLANTDEEIMKILYKMRKDLAEILKGDEVSQDETHPYKVYAEAALLDNVQSTKKFSLMNQLSKKFDMETTALLMREGWYLESVEKDAADIAQCRVKSVQDDKDKSAGHPPQINKKSVHETDKRKEITAAVSGEEKGEETETEMQEAAFKKKLPIMQIMDINKKKVRKRFKAKEFLNKLPKGRSQTFTSVRMLTQLYAEDGATRDSWSYEQYSNAERLIDKFIREGYVVEATLKGYPTCYLLTERGKAIFSSSKVEGILHIRKFTASMVCDEKVKPYNKKTASDIMSRIIFAKLRNAICKKEKDKKMVTSCVDNMSLMNCNDALLVISDFFENEAYIKKTEEVIVDYLKKTEEDIKTFQIIYASYTQVESRRRIAEIIKEKPSMKNVQWIIFDIETEEYHSYSNGEIIDVSEIQEKLYTQNEEDDVCEKDIDKEQSDDKEDTERIDVFSEEEIVGEKKKDSVSEEREKEKGEKNGEEETNPGIPICEDTKEAFTKETEKKKILNFIADERFDYASAYLKYDTLFDPDDIYYKMFAYAVADPLLHKQYNAGMVSSVFEVEGDYPIQEELYVAAVMRTLFYNKALYDDVFNIDYIHDRIDSDRFGEIKKIIYIIKEFRRETHKGMDYYAAYRFKDVAEIQRRLDACREKASEYYEYFIELKKPFKCKLAQLNVARRNMYKKNDSIEKCLRIIRDDCSDKDDTIETFITKFMTKNSGRDSACLDDDLIFEFIDEYWMKAGEEHRCEKIKPKLNAHFKKKIVKEVRAILELICDYMEERETLKEISIVAKDEYKAYYETIKKDILPEIQELIKDYVPSDSESYTVRAGKTVIKAALEEIGDRMTGVYNANSNSYYYVDFLKSGYVMLDENYLPEFGDELSEGDRYIMKKNILRHEEEKFDSVEEMFDCCFAGEDETGGDNFGEALLIDRYISVTQEKSLLKENVLNISELSHEAFESLEMALVDFKQNMEVACSCGRIPVNAESKKESYIHAAEQWFDYAEESHNYGYFRVMMQAYEENIRREGRKKGQSLLKDLRKVRYDVNSSVSREIFDKRKKKIEEMIDKEIYTVAEDILSRIDKEESYFDKLFEEDYLKLFLDDYDRYYRQVNKADKGVSELVRIKDHGKNTKGGRNLISYWMKNGQRDMSVEKLSGFLNMLEFNVGNVEKEAPLEGDISSYRVYLKRPENGRKVHLKHPIAAFGSLAIEEGFRVVPLVGRYDAKTLMSEAVKIDAAGGCRNTLILLDFALDKAERHTMARKFKTDDLMGTFLVIDRVMLMFLAKNYRETEMNSMLMKLALPFTYYQGYISASSKYMPPEMFTGRTSELARIENPSGVNIVYGGRQLGKSRLLKQAREDINRNENNDRAVLIDIKGKDYRKAAKAIGYALYQEDILDEDPDTEDWFVLEKRIKERLSAKKNRIPYLLILLDEADAFLKSSIDEKDDALQALKHIQEFGKNRFKFVVAGLRNVMQFYRKSAESNNSVLSHFESLTVKPFNRSEGQELIEKALYYLGLRFENQELIDLILATTNYFPGLIQLYCKKLIEAFKVNYAGYTESAPPYVVQIDHIKKVLADKDYHEEINKMFNITLKLHEDDYYEIISVIISFQYYNSKEYKGSTIEEIMHVADEWDIEKINNLSRDQIKTLTSEMCDLNILRECENGRFKFSKQNFIAIIGNKVLVEDKLLIYSVGMRE